MELRKNRECKWKGYAIMTFFLFFLVSLVSAGCQDNSWDYGQAHSFSQICWDSYSHIVSSNFNTTISCNQGSDLYFRSDFPINCYDFGCSLATMLSSPYTYYYSSLDDGKTLYFVCYNKQYDSNNYFAYSSVGIIISNLKYVDCLNDKCDGTNYYSCEKNKYNFQGIIKGKCGVSCSPIGQEMCNNFSYSICNNYKWEDLGKTLDKCDYGYWNYFLDWWDNLIQSMGLGSLAGSPINFYPGTGGGLK